MLIIQKLFNKITIHLLTQKEKSKDDMGCLLRYETENKKILRCAVGCLIDDKYYTEELENIAGIGLDINIPLEEAIIKSQNIKRKLKEEEIELLSRLQDMHDMKSARYWKNNLYVIAKEFKLNTDCLDSFKRKK